MARRNFIPYSVSAAGLCSLAALLISGCGSHPEPAVSNPTSTSPERRGPASIRVSSDPWVLSTDQWDGDYRGAYLGNGYVGSMFGLTGTSLPASGPEPSYVAGAYADEALAKQPPLLPLQISAKGQLFGADPKRIKKYHQELRLREGLLVTRATWDTGSGEADLELTTALLRSQPDLALVWVRLTNRGQDPVTVGVPDTLRGPQAGGGAAGAFTLAGAGKVSYRGILRSLGGQLQPAPGMGLGYAIPNRQSGSILLMTRVSGGVLKPEQAAPGLELTSEVDPLLAAHKQAWQRLWARDIEIQGDPEAQQAVRCCLFYLFSSVRPENTAGVPPMGLSSAAFNGHVFWDMDSWMFPAVLPQHPELARAMLEYRYRTLSGARANAQSEKLPGASYAWESGSTGRETLQGAVFSHGRHVTGDVALALRQYYAATGDRAWLQSRAWPILKDTADNWLARAKPDGKGKFAIPKVTTPDELANQVDYSAWTHHVARENLRFAAEAAKTLGQSSNPKWTTTADGLDFLRDSQGMILAYQGFNEKSKSKQADALLVAFPGELKLTDAELGRMYDFYAPRVIANGPAMTDAIHAVVAARLGRGDEALQRFRGSYQPFVRPPYMLFSEKRSKDNLCFLTGAAGVVEAALYGFGGLHLDSAASPTERPRLEPHLPKGWSGMKIHGLAWRGKSWDVTINGNGAPKWTPFQEK